MNVEHILFPVDFSARCEATVPFVREMAAKFGSTLTLLHSVEFSPYIYPSTPESSSAAAWELFEENYRDAQAHLAGFSAAHFAAIASVRTICDRGTPSEAILAQVVSGIADFIMMPTHGHSPFRSFMLGSVTAKVLHRATCPVWTGAHLEGGDASKHIAVRNILCAVDLEKDSVDVIQSAAALAEKFSAQLRLVHCVPAIESRSADQFISEFDRFLADSAREELARIQARAGTSLEVSMAGGSVAKVVRDAALTSESDLIVIGRGHAQAPFSRLRSNAHAIIRDAPCPVISL